MLNALKIPDKLIAPLARARLVIAEAQLALSLAQPELFADKPLLDKIASFISSTFFQFFKPLTVTGIADPTQCSKLAQGIKHYISHIDGGKQILNDAFKYGPITIHFGKVKGSIANWSPSSRTITIEYNGDFNELLKVLSKPPQVHIEAYYYDEHDPRRTIGAFIFEFRNAANNIFDADPLQWHPLMFKNAQDFGLYYEYNEFVSQTRGCDKLVYHFDKGMVALSFDEWYKKNCEISKNKKTIAHVSNYEAMYHDELIIYKNIIQKIRFIAQHSYSGINLIPLLEKNKMSAWLKCLNPNYKFLKPLELSKLVLIAMKKRTCVQVQKMLGFHRIEVLMAQAKSKKLPKNANPELALLHF